MIRSLIIAFLGVGAGLILGLSIGQRRGGEGVGGEEDGAKRIGRAVSVVSTGVGEGEAGVGEPSADAGGDAVKAYLEKLAEEHPAQAIAWVRRNEEDGERDELFRLIAERWAMGEPEAAFRWAAGVKRADERGAAYLGAVEGALKSGEQAIALGMVEQIPMGSLRDGVLQEAVGIMAEADVALAFEMAGQIGDTSALSRGVRAIMSRLIETGRAEEAKAMVMGMEEPYEDMGRVMVYGLVKAMAIENPRQALVWVSEETELLNESQGGSLAYYLALECADENPREATRWGEMLPKGRPRDTFLHWVGNRWIHSDPGGAGDWLVKEINEEGYDAGGGLAKGMLEEWVEIAHDQPFEYIERIEDGEARDRAMTLAMKELARKDPVMTAERLVGWETVDEEEAEEISDRLMHNWMRRDSKAASEWVNTLGPGIVKDAAISELVETVLRRDKDFEGARAWMNEVESEKIRDSLTRAIEYSESR